MSDADYLLYVLRAWRTWTPHSMILQWSFSDRGVGMTVHSRASDLRARGHKIECDVRTVDGRRKSFYRLTEEAQ